MLQKLFEDQRRYLDRFFELLDLVQAEKILDALFECKGTILFSGVGKSGHIAEKIAATFSSTGSRSRFLSPGNALHGDIGCLDPQDIVFLFSKSGETQELLDLLPYLKKKGGRVISAVSQANSRLAKGSHLSILLPVEKEICPFGLAPTTSTAAQLIFGDCLAVALMQKRPFTISDFAANHPAGTLGRKMTLSAADLMLKGEDIPLCRPEDRLIDVLHILSGKRCGCLVVADCATGRLRGIFTDGDLRRSIEKKGTDALQAEMRDLMTPAPTWIQSDCLAWEAMERMGENPARPISVLPVLEGGCVIGLLRMHDILQPIAGK